MLLSVCDLKRKLKAMTPRWLTIEKLVAELGGVCSSRYEMAKGAEAEAEAVPDDGVECAVSKATDAVTALLQDPAPDDDSIVRTAWTAIAQAQDAIARLRETMRHSRALRDCAWRLQDESLRLRRRQIIDVRDGSLSARRRTDPH